MVYIKKILVTTDLSEFSLAALEYASIPVLTVKPPPIQENTLQDEDVQKELHLW